MTKQANTCDKLVLLADPNFFEAGIDARLLSTLFEDLIVLEFTSVSRAINYLRENDCSPIAALVADSLLHELNDNRGWLSEFQPQMRIYTVTDSLAKFDEENNRISRKYLLEQTRQLLRKIHIF